MNQEEAQAIGWAVESGCVASSHAKDICFYLNDKKLGWRWYVNYQGEGWTVIAEEVITDRQRFERYCNENGITFMDWTWELWQEAQRDK